MKHTTHTKWLLAIAVTAASAISAQAAIQLAINGGFETGTTSGWTSFPSGTSTFTVVIPGASSTFAGEVANSLLTSAAVIKQSNLGVGLLTPGQSITVSFDLKESSGAGGVIFAELFSEIAGGGVSKSEILGGAPLFGGASFSSRSFTTTLGPDVSGGVTLQFAVATGGASGSFATGTFDNVSITVIPEPASGALLGLAGLVLVTRRRRHV